ncbi:MAG: hypothetical protein SOV83_06065 [Prevotella sp.]|nr:hypothetical protein [Prevotella sp.]
MKELKDVAFTRSAENGGMRTIDIRQGGKTPGDIRIIAGSPHRGDIGRRQDHTCVVYPYPQVPPCDTPLAGYLKGVSDNKNGNPSGDRKEDGI